MMNPIDETQRPWYREPWPWVLIAIPLLTVIAGFATLHIAITHPDYLVIEEASYQRVRSELRAQPVADELAEDELNVDEQ